MTKKDLNWLKEEIATEMIELEPNRKERWSDVKYQTLRNVAQKIYQLDEPEVLSQEENVNIVLNDLKEYIKEQQSLSQNVGLAHTSAGNDTHYRQYDYVLECIDEYEPSDELQNLLVPKHEELESKIKVLIEAYKQEDGAYSNPENGWISGFVEDLENLVEEKPEVLSHELPVVPKYVADWLVSHREKYDLYPALKRLEGNPFGWDRIYEWYRTNTHKFVNAYLTGEYEVEEEPLYYALIKGHELIDTGKVYWDYDKSNDIVLINELYSLPDSFLPEMSKSEWNELGINDSNADFVKADE